MSNKRVKSDVDEKKHVNETIEHVKEIIQYGIALINGKELESIKGTHKYDNQENKHKETSSTYDNEGEEKTSSTSENKEKSRDGYVRMYECGNNFCHSTHKHVWTKMYISISNTVEFIAK